MKKDIVRVNATNDNILVLTSKLEAQIYKEEDTIILSNCESFFFLERPERGKVRGPWILVSAWAVLSHSPVYGREGVLRTEGLVV